MGKFAVDKVKDSGNDKIALIEGNSFGYTDLVVDFHWEFLHAPVCTTILDITFHFTAT